MAARVKDTPAHRPKSATRAALTARVEACAPLSRGVATLEAETHVRRNHVGVQRAGVARPTGLRAVIEAVAADRAAGLVEADRVIRCAGGALYRATVTDVPGLRVSHAEREVQLTDERRDTRAGVARSALVVSEWLAQRETFRRVAFLKREADGEVEAVAAEEAVVAALFVRACESFVAGAEAEWLNRTVVTGNERKACVRAFVAAIRARPTRVRVAPLLAESEAGERARGTDLRFIEARRELGVRLTNRVADGSALGATHIIGSDADRAALTLNAGGRAVLAGANSRGVRIDLNAHPGIDAEAARDDRAGLAFAAATTRELGALGAADTGAVARSHVERGDTVEVATAVFAGLAGNDAFALEAKHARPADVGSRLAIHNRVALIALAGRSALDAVARAVADGEAAARSATGVGIEDVRVAVARDAHAVQRVRVLDGKLRQAIAVERAVSRLGIVRAVEVAALEAQAVLNVAEEVVRRLCVVRARIEVSGACIPHRRAALDAAFADALAILKTVAVRGAHALDSGCALLGRRVGADSDVERRCVTGRVAARVGRARVRAARVRDADSAFAELAAVAFVGGSAVGAGGHGIFVAAGRESQRKHAERKEGEVTHCHGF